MPLLHILIRSFREPTFSLSGPMPSDSRAHPNSHSLADLTHQCDQLLDQSRAFPEFATALLAVAVEFSAASAAALIRFSPPTLQVLAENSLGLLSRNGTYSLDPEHVTQIAKGLQQHSIMTLTSPHGGNGDLQPHAIIIAPLLTPSSPPRVLQLFLLEATPDPVHVAELKEIAETLVNYFMQFEENLALREQPIHTPAFWKQFDWFLIRLQQSMDLKQTASIAVNDGRSLVSCDRMSLALKQGGRIRIAAISGQEQVQYRANLVKSMARVAEIVLRTGTTVTYRGVVETIPPLLESPLSEYLAESRMRMIHMVPLRESAPLNLEENPLSSHPAHSTRRVMGLLIVEQATDSRPRRGVIERTELVAPHLEIALSNSERYESIFLLPVLRGLGRGIRWFKGRRFWTAMAVLAGLMLVGIGLWLIPWEYRVEGKGLAMPVVRHEVFAPWDANVLELRVESGQRVKTGDILLVLDSDEFGVEEISVTNELQEKQKLILALTQQQHAARRKNDRNELVRLESEFVKAKVEAEGAEAKLDKIRDRIRKLTILAPADGVVATFQLEQLLQNRPVQRGDLLVQIMEPEGDWRLELEIPEYRMGHVLRAFSASSEHELPVDYVLATAVETSHSGMLTTIATRSNESASEGTIVEAHVDIDERDLPDQNIGAEVIAKVHCGKKSLFYVLFGDVVEFLQRYLWL